MAIVNNQSELQAAIAAHDSFIQVDTDITLTARLVIRYAVVISSIDSANVRTIFKGESFFGNMFSKLYYTHSCMYMMVYLCIIFVYSGLFSALGTGLGIFSTNRFIPLIFPFVVYLFEGTVAGALQYPQWAIENFLIPAQRVMGITFPIVLIEAVILLLVCVGMYVYGANHDETL